MNVLHYQSFCSAAGESVCYASVITKIACNICKLPFTLENIGKCLDIGFDKGYITMNQNDYKAYSNFTVQNPAAWLSKLTGKTYTVTVESADYKAKKDEIEVLFYALNKTNADKGIGHFRLADYDPIAVCNTVKNGKVYSKRIFREK